MHKFFLSVMILILATFGSLSFAQSQAPNAQLINFDERRSLALARIKNASTAPTNEQRSSVTDSIRAKNGEFANNFEYGLEAVSEGFEQELNFFQSFQENVVKELLETKYAEVDFATIEKNYSNELTDFSAKSIAEIYLTGKILIDRILFEEYISMLSPEARAPLDLELKRLLSEHPSVPSISPGLSKPEIDATLVRATVTTLMARRLAASSVGRRLLSGLGKRLFQNAIGRGTIAVLAPGGEFCGPAVLLCEAGLFVGAVGWDGYQYRDKVVEAVKAGLQNQSTALREELLSSATIDPIWDVISIESMKLLEAYRDAVEQIMLDTFDDVIEQNADFMAENLPVGTDDKNRTIVFRKMATIYGDGFLQYTWSQRFAFSDTMDDRARALLDTHGSAIIDLFLVRPEILARVVRSGASDTLLSAILRSEDAQTSLTQIAEAIRRTGRLSADSDAVLADVLSLKLKVQAGEIDPLGIRLAAGNAAKLRTMATESPNGGILYAQVIQGVYSAKALNYILSSSNPVGMAEVLAKIPRKMVAELTRTAQVFDLNSFISAFPIEEGAAYLASAEASSYLAIFLHRSGGPKAVRAWDDFLYEYARAPASWMYEQFLWVADQGYEPSSVSLRMINSAYDTSDHPEFYRKFQVWWAHITGWEGSSFLLLFIFALAVIFFLPRHFRSIPRPSRSNSSDSDQIPRGFQTDKKPASKTISADMLDRK